MNQPWFTPTTTALGYFYFGGSRYYSGLLDELSLYSVARTADQILTDAHQFDTPSADVGISQTATPDPVTVGSNLLFSILATNAGPANATNVMVQIAVPPSANVLSVTPGIGAWTNSGALVTWQIDSLANNASALLSLVVVPGAPGLITNTCTITSAMTDAVTINNSSVLDVTVLAQPPTIVTPLIAQSVCLGDSATFTVTAGGTGPLSYQWQLNGTNLTGEVGVTLNLTNLAFSQAGVYSVIVSNAAAAVTNSANLVVVGLKFYAGLTIGGPAGINYRVEYTTALDTNQWTVLTNVIPTTTPYLFIDANSPGNAKRFYRATAAP